MGQTSQTLPSYVPIIPSFGILSMSGENFSISHPLAILTIIIIIIGIHCLIGQGIQARIGWLAFRCAFSSTTFFVEPGEGRLIRWLGRGVPYVSGWMRVQ